VDPTKLGLGLTAIIRFKSPGPAERTFAAIKACPEIIECHDVTGDDCITMTAALRSVEHLRELIARLAPYGASNTSIVLSSPVPRRAITPTALMVAGEL
jgi:Lrp/AsnC family transcriptional regulator, leucine-responsive regulatory protein